MATSDQQEFDVPFGIAELLKDESKMIARRVFLLDNSWSTSMGDGKYLAQGGRAGYQMVPCTRWEEICNMAIDHAKWNAMLGVPAEFHILNPMGDASTEGIGYVVVDASSSDFGSSERQVEALRLFLQRNQPNGATPLSKRLGDIRQRIQRERATLTQEGQRVVVVIATDGMPTTPYSGTSEPSDRFAFVAALRELVNIDAYIVLRLCTDEQPVVDFYGDIDAEVELNLEVLDDIESEALELQKLGNGFFTYTPLLHKIREGGCFLKVLDIVDERPLTRGDIYLLLQYLLKRSASDDILPPDPEEFCTEVERRLVEDYKGEWGFDPLKKAMAPPVDTRLLRKAMGCQTGLESTLSEEEEEELGWIADFIGSQISIFILFSLWMFERIFELLGDAISPLKKK